MSITYTIDNAGQAAITGNSPYWIERIYMSSDNVLDGSDRLLNTLWRSLSDAQLPLPEGQSHFTVTEKVMLPVGVDGNFYFFVTVSPVAPVSNVFQSNDFASDATPTQVRLTPPPDLVLSGISMPSSAVAGHDLTFSYRVINEGSTPTPNSSWYDKLYLSTDSTLDSGDISLADVIHYGRLDPAGTAQSLSFSQAVSAYESGAASGYYINTVTVRLAEGMSGTYHLIAATDTRNEVFELDRTNNIYVSSDTVTIENRPVDLVVTDVSAPTAAQAGNSLRVFWTVMNQGIGYSSADQWVDRVVVSSDAILGNGDDVTLGYFTHTGILNVGQTYSNSVLVSLPAFLSGQYQLFVETDSWNQVYEYGHEDNNSRLFGASINGQPGTGIQAQPQPTADLQVTSVTAPSSISSGDLLTVDYTVVNAGLGRTNAEWWADTVILSKDLVVGNADDVNLGTVYHSNRLGANESYQGSASLKLPIDLQGDYHVIVRTDTYGQVIEPGGENNNDGVAAGTTTINLRPTPDLVMTSLQAADLGTSGQNLQVAWTVHNNGSDTNGGWRQVFYLSRDGVLDRNTDIYLGYADSQTALSGNGDASFSQSFRIPDGISGKYYLFGVVDSNDWIYERGGEGNNTAMDSTSVQITQPQPVDLVAGVITVPDNGIAGGEADIAYTVTNQSERMVTGQWRDNIYISKDAVWDVGDTLFSRVEISGPLAGGESYTQKATGHLPGVVGGDYYVIVRSDILNQVPETNEINNLKASVNTTHIDVQALTLGSPDSSVITVGGSVFYKVDVASGETLKINFDRAGTDGRTELFVSYGSVPSRSDFDYKYNKADSPDQSLVIANTKAGSYYVMAYNASGATDNYAINASTLQFSITELGTTTGSNKGEVTVRISGAELTTHTAAILVGADGTEHAAAEVYWKDGTELWATFDLRGLDTGAYDVKVQDGARSAVLNDGFTINSGAVGHIEYSMQTPSALRVGQIGAVRVYYQNVGDTDVAAPLLTVTGNALLKASGDAPFSGTSVQLLGINSAGPAGILSPGAQGSFQLFFKANFAGGGTVNLQLSDLKADQVIDWNTLLDPSRPDNLSDEVWASIKANLIAQLGLTTTDYQNNLAANASYLDQLESRTGDVATLFGLDCLKATNGGVLLSSSTLGVLGYNQAFAWDNTALRQSDGSVIVNIAGQKERFELQADGSYKLSGQGSSTLTQTAGAFVLHQKDGTTISFNIDGSFSEIVDSNGHSRQAVYDSGHLTQIVFDNGEILHFTYNDAGRLVLQSDQEGRTVSYTYDADKLHLLSITTAEGTTEFGYVTGAGAALNLVSSITLPDGIVRHFDYDASGRLVREYLNDGAEAVSFSYLGVNEVIATDAAGSSNHLWLNACGQIAQVEDALGHVSQLHYDLNDNLVGTVNADGSSTAITYDAAGRTLSVQDALGHTIDFSYDSQFGHLARVTDQRGDAIDYGYDSHGNVHNITYADGSSQTYAYDAAGHLSSTVTRDGETVSYTFDSNGHLTQKSFADGSVASYTYDSHGNLTSATDSDSHTSFQYDTADRLVRVTDGEGRWLSYQYDAAGHRSEMSDQDGHVTKYSYDAFGHLVSLTDGADNLIAAYHYDVAGHLSRGDNGNGTYTTYSYDAAGELTHLVNFKSDGTVNSRFDYTYDESGHRTSETTLDGTTSYQYDAIGQLTDVTLSGGRHIAYHYDAAGNRSIVEDSGITTSYATNNLNEYTSAGSVTYSYDANGNLMTRSDGGVTTTYGYDAENHLVSVMTPTDSWSFEYDALGNRIASVHNGVRSEYQLDPTGMVNVAAEYDAGGNQVASYTYGLGLESETLNSGVTAWYDYNAIGSTTGLTGSAGTYLNQYTYLPFGEKLAASETVANSFEYIGQWGVMDAGNGLDLMRARIYSEADGRFVQQNALGVAGGLPTYGYADNSPVNYADPSGYVTWSQNGQGAFSVAGGTLSPSLLAGALATAVTPMALTIGTVVIMSNVWKGAIGLAQLNSGTSDLSMLLHGNLLGDLTGASGNDTAHSIGQIIGDAYCYASGTVLPADQYTKLYEWGISSADCKIEKVQCGVQILDRTLSAWDWWAKLVGNTVSIVRPSDPNDIVGPRSFGDEHWVSAQSALPYTIHFENQASATAPAQQVTITQTLDSDLNPGSFRLGDFGWGDVYVHVPDGASFYIDRIDLTSTKGYMVDVLAGIDVAKHEAYWSFTTIDPNTGEIPADPTVGFLLPDTDGSIGQAFVNYTVLPNAGAPTGTVIDAKATIVFTTQEPIDTPAIFSTLDTQSPDSHIETGADTVHTAQFLVSWSGSDVGSAIAGYSVYVSDNGGAYTPWIENTTLTEATYAGQPGHTYAFYTVATDNAGNSEAAPAQADLTIRVTGDAAMTDTQPPQISGVTLPADGLYAAGHSLDFAVKFTETVIVNVSALPPVIKLTVGNTEVDAVYQSGSGSDTLVFRHTIADGEYDDNGIALSSSIVLNGASLHDVAGNPLTDPGFSAGATDGIRIDNPPTLHTALADQSATQGQNFSFHVPDTAFAEVDTGDSLSYVATLDNGDPLPGWLSFNAATHTFSGTPLNENVGSIDVKVTATDSSLASVTDTFSLAVANVNDAPTGEVTISGTVTLGETLTAHNTLADADGLGTISYQWSADGTPVIGATGESYALQLADVGKTITAVASYTDGHGTPESVSSVATQAVSASDHIAPTVVGFSPADAATGVAVGSDIILTFSEAIQKGAGLIEIHDGSATGTVVESFDAATNSHLSILGDTLIINPTSDLAGDHLYFVTFDTGIVRDFADNVYVGSSDYDFTTAAASNSSLYDLSGSIKFWKTGAPISGVTSTATSAPTADGSQPVEFRTTHVAADGSRTVEIWETSSHTGIDSLQLELTLPTGSVASWQDATLPAGWFSMANTETAGQFILGGFGLTALSAGPVKLGTLTLSAPSNPSHFELSLTSGELASETIPAFTIVSDTSTTGADGLYDHLALASGVYTLDTTKAIDSSVINAVKANDALAALKIAVNMNPNGDGSTVASYQFLAADVNKDGRVNASDALNILKMAVHLDTAPAGEWLFVPDSVGAETMTRTSVLWPDSSVSVTLDHDQELQLIGIVKGDVNGSWAG